MEEALRGPARNKASANRENPSMWMVLEAFRELERFALVREARPERVSVVPVNPPVKVPPDKRR